MQTLELKHLAPYLPYGLKMQSKHGVFELTLLKRKTQLKRDHILYKKVYPVWANDTCEGNIAYLNRLNCCGRGYQLNEIKPILRPLSHLFKTNGFSVSNLITHGYHNDFWSSDKFSVTHLYWHDMQLLLQHHFDVFGLIDAGLAIDINTLNP